MSGMNSLLIIVACSGPGAATAIQQNITIGYFCAAIGAVITLALAYNAWRSQQFRFTLPIAAVLLLLHPAWTISAVHGDCGFFKRDASYTFLGVYFVLMVYQYVATKRVIQQARHNEPPPVERVP